MNGKLEDIGERSGVTPGDIKQIRSISRKARVFKYGGKIEPLKLAVKDAEGKEVASHVFEYR